MAEDTPNPNPTGNDAVTTPPAAPPTPSVPAETTSVPASSELASPSAPQVPQLKPEQQQQQQPEQPEAPGSHFKNLGRAMVGSILGGLAGPHQAIDHYEVDAQGKNKAVMRDLHPRERLQRLAQAALEGLAAGSQVGPQKSSGGAWAAGLGAGAEQSIARSQQQDLLKRQQSKEDYETQQKTLTDKAMRAMHNASTFSLWQKAMEDQNDHDPERQKNMDIVNSARDYISRNPGTSLKVDIVTPEQAKAMHDADNTSAAKHTFLPLGMTAAKDANGQPLSEADGKPKQSGQIAVIQGGENMPLPQSFVNDLKEYGKLAGINAGDRITAGTEWPMANFLNADTRMNAVKKQEIAGWTEAKDAVLPDGKTHVQVNNLTGKTRPYPEGVTPLDVKKTEADIGQKKAAADKDEAEAAKFREEASGEGTKNMAADIYGGRMSPTEVSNRKPEFKQRVLQSLDDLARADGKAGYDWEKDVRDWTYAKDTRIQDRMKFFNSLVGADNKSGNLGQLVMKSDQIKRTSFPALNDAAAWARLETGDKSIVGYRALAIEVADKIAKILQGGSTGNGTSDAKLQQASELFKTGFTKGQIREVSTTMRDALSTVKKETIGTNRYLSKDYGDPMVDVQIPGQKPGRIPRANIQQFRLMNPSATVSE